MSTLQFKGRVTHSSTLEPSAPTRLPSSRNTAKTPCWWVRRSDCSRPPPPSFPACPACHRQSGRRSACLQSCGWYSCGSSSAGRGSASRSSSWVCSCTDPSAWPPVIQGNSTKLMNFWIWSQNTKIMEKCWKVLSSFTSFTLSLNYLFGPKYICGLFFVSVKSVKQGHIWHFINTCVVIKATCNTDFSQMSLVICSFASHVIWE